MSTYTILEKETKRTWDDAVAQCARVPGRHIALLDTTGEKDLLRQAAMGVGATLGWYWMREAGVNDCSTMNLNNQRWKSAECTKSWFYICEQEGTRHLTLERFRKSADTHTDDTDTSTLCVFT